MTEYHPVVVGKSLVYSGYCQFGELWSMVRDFMETRGYHYLEKQHNELVGDEGKNIFIEVDVDKELSDYVKSRIIIRCTCGNLTDVEVTTDNKKKRLNDGKVQLEFDTYILTDYEGRYADRSTQFFLRTIIEKFVVGTQIKKFKHIAEEDLEALIKEIKAYLNLFQS